MTGGFGWTEWTVSAGGLGLAAFVLWYFLASPRQVVAARTSARDRTQEVRIVVKGGYAPEVVLLRRGVPARLIVQRGEDGECSEELVLADFGVRRFLAPFATTIVEFTPEKAGEFTMTCGMGMLHGRVVVR
jgi:plastocyanin domain-containing protein